MIATVHTQMLGMGWMDPQQLLDWTGPWFFWVSVLIIFVECGLFFPFLPGDTLLFAIGLFIATDRIDIMPGHHSIDLVSAVLLFGVSGFLGNVAGYEIGRKVGPPLYERDGRLLKRKYFDQTRVFFDTHGNKALVIGRFVPFVRTFITVVAGVTRMERRRFFFWSAVGVAPWVLSITLLGYFLGTTVPWLADNIDYVTIVLLLFTVIPLGVEWLRHRRHTDDAEATGSISADDVPEQTEAV